MAPNKPAPARCGTGLGTSRRAGLTGDELGDGDAVLRQGLLQPFLLHVAGVAPGEVAKAVSHATVQEIWYIIGGEGQMWRRQEGQEPTTENLRPGICLTIPLGTAFQFRADSPDELF